MISAVKNYIYSKEKDLKLYAILSQTNILGQIKIICRFMGQSKIICNFALGKDLKVYNQNI